MKCFENSGKLRELRNIAKNAEKRQKLLKKTNSRGHKIKRAITIGMLLAMLATPTVARANAPVEFENERLLDYDIEEVLKVANNGDIEVTPEDWNLNISTSCYVVDGVSQPPFRIDITNGTAGEFPIKLLSPEGQQALLDRIDAIPTLEEIYVTVDLPNDMIKKIEDSGEYKVFIEGNEDLAISHISDYIEKNDAIVIYDLSACTREGEWSNYKKASVKDFTFESSIKDLKKDELALLNLDSFHACEENDSLNIQGEVCIQIPNVVELSTEEAIRIKDKVDYIQIVSGDSYSNYEAKEVYTIDEYIEVSKGIDAIVEKVDPNASDFEKAFTIYCEIGKSTTYNNEEAEKNGRRRKEVGNLYGVFVEGSSVCAGIAESYKAVCQRVGLDAEYISGQNDGAFVGHAWNQVKINGKWVDIDLTGDLKYIQTGEQPIFFGSQYIDFDNMSENHHSNPEERAVIKQEFITKALELRNKNMKKDTDYEYDH